LFKYGIGIHLLESDNVPTKKGAINPKDNHISFQCSDMKLLMQKLEEMNIEYVTAVVEEGGITVDQLFFHDPDGYMIEICNCQNLPVLPLSSCPLKLPKTTSKSRMSFPFYGRFDLPFTIYLLVYMFLLRMCVLCVCYFILISRTSYDNEIGLPPVKKSLEIDPPEEKYIIDVGDGLG
jgi:hypothetical protein